jgi:hypothetical protein
LYHSTLGVRVIQKKKRATVALEGLGSEFRSLGPGFMVSGPGFRAPAAERKGKTIKGFEDVYLKIAQSSTRIWL